MTPEERIRYAKEKAKESARKFLEEMPEDVRKEFEKESTQGSPDNLVKPDKEDE